MKYFAVIFLVLSGAVLATDFFDVIARKKAADDWVTWATDNSVGYWRMNEANGNLADSSGNGYTLTANGTPTYAQTGLLPNDGGDGAITFSGDDYFSTDSALGFSDYPVTICMGFTATASATDAMAFLGDKDAGNAYISAEVINGTTQYASATGRNTSTTWTSGTETDINTGSTFFLMFVWASATDREVFVNGVSDGTSTSSISAPAFDRFTIGRLGDSTPGSNFAGTLDEVVILNTDEAANATEIYDRFNDN